VGALLGLLGYPHHHSGSSSSTVSTNPLLARPIAVPAGISATSTYQFPVVGADEVTGALTNHRTVPVALSCSVTQTGVTGVPPDVVSDIGPIRPNETKEFTATMPYRSGHPDTYDVTCSLQPIPSAS
jgi:hypothetical protein